MAIYANSLKNGFVYDDEVTVVNNVLIKSLSNLDSLFSVEYFALSGEASYRPLVTLTYMLDYFLWGLNPSGYHLTNLLLHIVSVSFLYLLTVKLWGEKRLALVAAAIFALSPVNTEAVNSISFREDLLITPLCILSLITHISLWNPYTSRIKSQLFKYGAPLLYFLALLSKEMAITLPALAIVIDYYKYKTFHFKRYMIYLVFTVLYLIIRFFIFTNMVEHSANTHSITLITSIPSTISFYIRIFLFPVNLVADYAGDIRLNPLNGFLLMLAACLFFKSTTDKIKIPITWFFISLIPVLNIVPIKHPIAERFLYFPSIGMSILLAIPLYRFNTSKKTILVCLLFFYSLMTFERNRVWRDNYSLWMDTLEKMPASFMAHNNLGMLYEQDGRLKDAIEEYKKALELNPDSAETHTNLGFIYRRQDKLVEAKEEHLAALQLKPNFVAARLNLGIIYLDQGLLEKALQEFQIASKLNPYNADAYYNIGLVYYRWNQIDRAIENFKYALKLNPSSPVYYNELANAYLQNNQVGTAIEYYKTALKIKPDYAEAHSNLGSALFSQGMVELAIEEYIQAITIKADYIDAHFNLGLAYWRSGNKEYALKEFNYILSVYPTHKQAQKIVGELSK